MLDGILPKRRIQKQAQSFRNFIQLLRFLEQNPVVAIDFPAGFPQIWYPTSFGKSHVYRSCARSPIPSPVPEGRAAVEPGTHQEEGRVLACFDAICFPANIGTLRAVHSAQSSAPVPAGLVVGCRRSLNQIKPLGAGGKVAPQGVKAPE